MGQSDGRAQKDRCLAVQDHTVNNKRSFNSSRMRSKPLSIGQQVITNVTQSLVTLFRVSFLVSLKTLGFALVFGTLGLVPKMILAWETVVGCEEGLCYTTEICKRRYGDSLFSRWGCYCFEYKGILDSFWLNMFLPCVSFLCYVQVSNLKLITIVMSQGVMWLIQLGWVYLNPNYEIAKLFLLATPFSFVVPATLFKLMLPNDSYIPRMVMKAFVISCLGSALVQFYDKLQSLRIGFVLVIYPLFRMSCFAISRTMAKQMAINKRVAGTGVKVRRNFAMLTALIVQILISTWYRLIISSIGSTWEFAIFMIVSTVQEIGMRLTLPWQDWFFEHGFTYCSGFVKQHTSSSVILPVRGSSSETSDQSKSRISSVATLENMMQTEEEWNASMIITEMITEQIGIVAAAGLVLMYKDDFLVVPLPIFLEMDDPFSGNPFNYSKFLSRLGSQLLGEVLVDTICIVIETKRFNYPLEQAFGALKTYGLWAFVTCYLLATWTAVTLSVMFINGGTGGKIQTQPCLNVSICSCGPSPDNLYGEFCALLH